MLVEVIENTPESREFFHKRGWGGGDYVLTSYDIKALLDGKCLAINDGEYTHILELKLGDE